jgi:opacity protein-like surface antigen
MKLTSLLATAAVTLAAAVSAATAAPADQAGAVKADLTQLQSDITKAHDTLLADVAKVTADIGKGREAVKADIQSLRTDRESLVGAVQADLAQLKSDLKAARDAKVDPGDLKSLLQSVRELAKSDRADVHQAVQNARGGLKALEASAATKS